MISTEKISLLLLEAVGNHIDLEKELLPEESTRSDSEVFLSALGGPSYDPRFANHTQDLWNKGVVLLCEKNIITSKYVLLSLFYHV